MECTTGFFDISHYIKAMIGINNGVSDGRPEVRFMQVASVGDYFTCAGVKDVANERELFYLLLDTNHCGHPVLRVDIATDDGLCVNFQDCNQKEMDAFTALKHAIGMGADGAPVLRIMLSSGLS